MYNICTVSSRTATTYIYGFFKSLFLLMLGGKSICMGMFKETIEEIRSPGTRIAGGCELHCMGAGY